MLLIKKMCCFFAIKNVSLGNRKSSFVIERLCSGSLHAQCFKRSDILTDRHPLETQTSLHISACTHLLILDEPGLLCSKIIVARSKPAYGVWPPSARKLNNDGVLLLDVYCASITFGIIGSYLFLHIWEGILSKLGK